uniref:Hairy/enhancer-of-split related with YRPW motif protein 1 n=1 Tax=Anisakis simplex TaxID=6269 RepID=A0A0M3J9Z3_ANISI
LPLDGPVLDQSSSQAHRNHHMHQTSAHKSVLDLKMHLD